MFFDYNLPALTGKYKHIGTRRHLHLRPWPQQQQQASSSITVTNESSSSSNKEAQPPSSHHYGNAHIGAEHGLMVQVWYPLSHSMKQQDLAKYKRAEYMSRELLTYLHRLAINTVPEFLVMNTFGSMIPRALLDAPPLDEALSSSASLLPVAIFSHGMYGCPEIYSAYCEHLASVGYLVFSIYHTDQSSLYVQYPLIKEQLVQEQIKQEVQQEEQSAANKSTTSEATPAYNAASATAATTNSSSAASSSAAAAQQQQQLKIHFMNVAARDEAKQTKEEYNKQLFPIRNTQLNRRVKDVQFLLDWLELLQQQQQSPISKEYEFLLQKKQSVSASPAASSAQVAETNTIGNDNNNNNNTNSTSVIYDMNRIGILGHSFGAGTAYAATGAEPKRIKCGVALDGWLFAFDFQKTIENDQGLTSTMPVQPFFFINSELWQWKENLDHMDECLKNEQTAQHKYYHVMKQSKHQNFSDVAIVLPNLGKLAGTLGGDAKLIHKQTNQLVEQFFDTFVLNQGKDEQKTAALEQYKKKLQQQPPVPQS